MDSAKTGKRAVTVERYELIVLSVFPLIVAGAQHLLAWLHYRRINRDAPLTPYQRRLTMYLDFFILGMGYAMVLSVAFHMTGLRQRTRGRHRIGSFRRFARSCSFKIKITLR